MIFPHALVLSTLLLTTFASPTPQPSESVADWALFHRLIDNVDESSIHAILHSLAPKFKHGVFSKDRSAIEQVHSENPPLATQLVNLAKRASNTTTTQNSAQASSSIASVESSLASVASSISTAKTSLTSAQQSLSSAESSASSQASVASSAGTTEASVTSAKASQTSKASQQASSAAVLSSQQASLTSAQASLSSELAASSAYTASTKPADTSLALAPTTPTGYTPVATTHGAVIFSSQGGGEVTVASSTAFVTYSRASSEILSTYTLPNGQLTTATSVVVVNAPITASVATAEGNGAASTASGSAGLQSGASTTSRWHLKELVLMLGGAAAIAMML